MLWKKQRTVHTSENVKDNTICNPYFLHLEAQRPRLLNVFYSGKQWHDPVIVYLGYFIYLYTDNRVPPKECHPIQPFPDLLPGEVKIKRLYNGLEK